MNERIRDILLQHKGKSNAIASKEISRVMGFPMEDTQSVSRKAIWETAERYRLPLVSCNKGYFIAENDKEIDDYNANIKSRIEGMKRTRKMVNEFYQERKNELHN